MISFLNLGIGCLTFRFSTSGLAVLIFGRFTTIVGGTSRTTTDFSAGLVRGSLTPGLWCLLCRTVV